jgi:putative ABC transport system permease protein
MRLFNISLQALLSHWRKHPLQFFSIFTGLWLATMLWTGVQALNSQARADYARASSIISDAVPARLVARQGLYFDQSAYIQLRLSGWPVSPLLEGRLRFAGEDPLSLRLIGIDPLTLPQGSEVAGQPFGGADLGRFLGQPGVAWIAADTLERMGFLAGEQPVTADGQRLPPLQVHAQLAPGLLVVDIGLAQALLKVPGKLSWLLLPTDFTASALPGELAKVLKTQAELPGDDLQRLTQSFHLNLTALGFLAFFVGLLIVHASIGLALEQRRGLLRNLRTCGVSLRAMIAALAVELGVFALLGGLAGVISGYLLASALLTDVAASLRGLYGAEIAGQLSLAPQWWLAGLAISLLGTLLAGCKSLLLAARLPLLEVAKPQAWRLAQSHWLKRQAWLAAGLLGIALACWRLGDSLLSAFFMLASLLLAAALLLPALLDGALAGLARYCRGPLAEWFVADSRQQLPALTLALMALLLALAASVGVGSMTEGFRKTFVGWLDQRLSAELYINPRDTDQGLQLIQWLSAQTGIEAILPLWQIEVRLQDRPVRVQGIISHASYRQHWPLLEQQAEAWSKLDAGQGAMLSEQLARQLKLGLGDSLTLTTATGEQALPVVGLYADYGNPRGQMLVSSDRLRKYWAQASLVSLSLRMPVARTDAVKQAIEKRFGLEPSRLIDQASLKRWSTRVFDRTFAATAALNSLTLGVAGIALFISLLTLGQSRLAQLAPLWALGLERRHLAWLSLTQTVLLAGLTALLSIPLGLLLAWCLVAVVNVQAFGWRLPLYVFPAQLLQLCLLGLLTSILAAAGPLWQLARRQPADLLRQFADER